MKKDHGTSQKTYSTQSRSGKSNTGGKQRNRKPKPRVEEQVEAQTNDPQWYFADPVLSALAGDLNWTYPAGRPVPIYVRKDAAFVRWPQKQNGQYVQNADWSYKKIPSILSVRVYPSVGNSIDPSSPINTAAKGIRAYQRSTSTGSTNYDSPDLMMYIAANADVYSYIVWLQRIAAIVPMSNQLNYSYPELMLQANYVDPVDVTTNIRHLWSGIESLIVKAARLVVPSEKVLPIFARRAFMFSSVYTEGSSTKDQLYMYTPAAFYKFGIDDRGQGQLVLAGEDMFKPGVYNTVDQLIAFGNQLINAIYSDDTHATMSGDLMKAYAGNIVKLAPLNVDAVIAPTFDITVLEQIKNAIAVGKLIGGSVNQVNTVGDQPYITSVYYGAEGIGLGNDTPNYFQVNAQTTLGSSLMVTTSTVDVSTALAVENTRLVVGLDFAQYEQPGHGSNTGDTAAWAIVSGSEICEAFYTWTSNGLGDTPQWDRHIYAHVSHANSSLDETITLWRQTQDIASFKFHPRVAEFVEAPKVPGTVKQEESLVIYVGDTFDYDNFAILNLDVMREMHESCLLSLFGVSASAVAFSRQG
nr:putative capsid [Marmot picobirnavirus]